MKLIAAPHLGSRPIDEFVYGGPLRPAPDAGCSDEVWGDYIFHRDGVPQKRQEWWYHRPTGSWLVLERDTSTDEIACDPGEGAAREGKP